MILFYYTFDGTITEYIMIYTLNYCCNINRSRGELVVLITNVLLLYYLLFLTVQISKN